jgi:hypothetical protein
MRACLLGALLSGLLLALAASATGASGARPPVALVAVPAHVDLAGRDAATVRVTNTGTTPVVVDVRRAGFSLDLRGRPRIVGSEGVRRSAAAWLSFRPRSLALAPGASAPVAIESSVPARAEPGDHDALVLLTTRPRVQSGVAVRMRMGVVVVVRAPGTVVRRLSLGRLRVARGGEGRARTLELVVVNRGNVTESFERGATSVSLFRSGRRVALLTGVPRSLRPATRGIVQFPARSRVTGPFRAVVRVKTGSGTVLQRSYRVRM